MTDENITPEVFKYLDILRKSGAPNMMGATPYIQQTFDVDKTTARTLLKQWMADK